MEPVGAFARLPPSTRSPWLEESATLWIDSASSDEEPVIRKPMNLVAAIPMLARNAARIAPRSRRAHRGRQLLLPRS